MNVFAGLVLAALVAAPAFAGPKWETDFEQAKKIAKEKGRPILADFSGSDWCGWCIKLDKEVFSQAEFQTYADASLVLLLLDFPRRKELPAAEKKQNQDLLERYGVDGFPTVLLLDADGNVKARTGYQRGGAEKYVAHIKELLGAKDAGGPAPAAE